MVRDSALSRQGDAASGHGLALALLAGALAAAAGALALTIAAADRPREVAGDVTAMFPPGASEEDVLRAVAASDGVVRRRGLLGAGWLVTSDVPGFAGRLRDHGAVAVLPAFELPALSLDGCSFLPPDRYERPDIRKLRAGPM
jgi:hypothetical protein